MAKRDENRSDFSFSSIVSAAPLGIGLTISARQYSAALKTGQLSITTNQPIIEAFNNRIRSSADFQRNLAGDLHIKPWQLDKFQQLADTGSLVAKQDIIATFIRAAEAANLPPEAVSSILGQLENAQSSQEVLRDLFGAISQNNSIYMARTNSIFLDNLSIAEERIRAGKSINFRSIRARGAEFSHQAKWKARVTTLEKLNDPILAQELKRATAGLGGAKLKLELLRRGDIASGSTLRATYTGGILGNQPLELKIPLALRDNPNVVVSGTNQQTTRIVGRYGILQDGAIKHSFNYDQWMAYRLNEDLVFALQKEQQLSGSTVRRAAQAFQASMLETTEVVDTVPRGINPGIDAYVKHRSAIMHLYNEGPAQYIPGKGFKLPDISLLDYGDLLEQHTIPSPEGALAIFPGNSPDQMAKGVVALEDARQLHLVPSAVAWDRRPLQGLRKFAPTRGAIEAMRRQNPFHEKLKWAAFGTDVEIPMLETAFVSERHADRLSRIGVGTQGIGLVSRDVRAQRVVREAMSFNISSTQLMDLADYIDVDKGASWEIGKKAPKGTWLGNDPSGRPVVLGEGVYLVGATAHTDESYGDFIKVTAERRHTNLQWSKGFLGGKEMLGEVSPRRLRKTLQKTFHFQGHADMLRTMAELKKNRQLHYQQMFTELWRYVDRSIRSEKGDLMSNKARRLFYDPRGLIGEMEQAATIGSTFDHDIMLRQIVDLAKEAKLSAPQMGTVFGAVPDVYGLATDTPWQLQEEWSKRGLGTLTEQEARFIRKGIARGFSQMAFGGLGGPGSGNRGSIEPRLMEILESPHWGGTLGKEIQLELSERLLSANPERIMEQETIGKSVSTMLNLSRLPGAVSASSEITRSMWDNGFNLSIRGIGDIMVPPSEDLAQLAQYKTPGGQYTNSQLGLAYRDLVEVAAKYERGELAKDVVTERIKKLTSEAGSAWTGTVTGKTGLLRNELKGSRFLTGVSDVGNLGTKLGPGEVGITAEYAEKLLTDMEEMYGKDTMASLRNRIFETIEDENGALTTRPRIGATFTTLLKRDPVIDQYSIQAVTAKLVKGEGPYLVTAEREVQAAIAPGRLENQALEEFKVLADIATGKELGSKKAAAKAALAHLGGEYISSFRTSPMIGLGMDLDADTASLIAVTPNLEQKLAKHLTYETDAYVVHEARMQLLKGKARKGRPLTFAEQAADAAMGLGIPKTELGPLSITLQEAKAAALLQQNRLGAKTTGNVLFLTTWLEQVAGISGKHIAPGEKRTMIDLSRSIQEAYRYEDTGKLVSAVEEVFATEKLSPQGSARAALLKEGITLSMRHPETGDMVTRHIPGVDLRETVMASMDTLHSFRALDASGISPSRLRELYMGRISPSTKEMRLLTEKGFDVSSLSAFFNPVAERGTFSKMVERGTTIKNKMIAAGKSAIPHLKPLGLGFAASLALSTLLSQPPITMSPEDKVAPAPNLSSGSGGGNLPTNIHPSSHITGSPSIPARASTPSAYISSRPPGALISVSGNSPGGTNYSGIQSSISNRLRAHQIRTTATVNDNRSSLTPQKLSDMIKPR